MATAKAVTSYADDLYLFASACFLFKDGTHTLARKCQGSRCIYSIARLYGPVLGLVSGFQLPGKSVMVGPLSLARQGKSSHAHIPLLPAPDIISLTRQ